jgi:hypothetical protein
MIQTGTYLLKTTIGIIHGIFLVLSIIDILTHIYTIQLRLNTVTGFRNRMSSIPITKFLEWGTMMDRLSKKYEVRLELKLKLMD